METVGELQFSLKLVVGESEGSHLVQTFGESEPAVETGTREGTGRYDFDVPGNDQISAEGGAFKGVFSDFEEGFREDQFPT